MANMLLDRGIRKDRKWLILLMNCLEWLPIYFGIMKAGGNRSTAELPLHLR